MMQPNRTRSLALVGPLDAHRRVTQTAGFPIDPSKILPAPDVILLIADADKSAMLFRYTTHGEFAGDTWHPSVDAAREHAIYDYSDALGEWIDVPGEVEDAHAFAIQYAAERLNSRGEW
ncbi:MAG TPA: hypothetical protein VFZ21_24315 [Gemmatimonadaceae bacterium]|nr:hypothetical protein [Gemmatimonadaceae bacterium]